MTPPPIALEPGETVVLSGGRSWHVWLYTIAFAPALCALLPLAALPWLFSGRYWLTQRRLIFAPPIGPVKTARLADITGVSLKASTAKLTVRTPQGSITVRFAQDFARLWGALVLLTELPVPEQTAAAQVRYLGSVATAKFPGGWQHGYAVNFNRRVVFLPNEKARSNVAEAGKLAGQLPLALVGVHVTRSQAQLPFDLWLSLWSHLPTDDFEALLHGTANARGGKVVPLEHLEVVSAQQLKHGEWSLNTRQPVMG
jgi:hypothetical protein